MLDRLSQVLKRHCRKGMTCTPVAIQPRPLVVVGWKGGWRDDNFDTALMVLVADLAKLVTGSIACSCVRCVDLTRLDMILSSGCDVEPTDAVLWVDKFPSKALEYGGDTKIMLIFDIRKTKATYEEVAADIEPQRLASLKAVYPTALTSVDGTKIWLSRLPEEDRRVASAYEIEHARWIPGDPFDALIGVLVLCRHPDELVATINAQCQSHHSGRWQTQA